MQWSSEADILAIMNLSSLLTTGEAADLLGLRPVTVRALTHGDSPELTPACRIGRTMLFRRSDIRRIASRPKSTRGRPRKAAERPETTETTDTKLITISGRNYRLVMDERGFTLFATDQDAGALLPGWTGNLPGSGYGVLTASDGTQGCFDHRGALYYWIKAGKLKATQKRNGDKS